MIKLCESCGMELIKYSKSKYCAECRATATNENRRAKRGRKAMKRLTFVEPNGEWGVVGMNSDNEKEKAYGCICKLRNYEDSGLSPSEVTELIDKVYYIEKKLETIESEHEQVQNRIRIGTEINGYIVTAMTDTSCMAERKYKIGIDDYVVWNIDADKTGVNNGMYFEEKEESVFNFANRLQRVRI